MVLVGDFLQLRPIPDNFHKDPGEYVFTSEKFNMGMTHKIVMRTVVRQADGMLSRAINELERGSVSDDTTSLLKGLHRPLQLPVNQSRAIHLFGTNFEVDCFNLEHLDATDGEQKCYKAVDSGSVANLKNMKNKKILRLKVDSPVVLVKNLTRTLVNGLQGTVVRLDDDGPVVDLLGHPAVKITPCSFSLYDCVGNTIVAARIQLPLALAYALTVHKAQGMTLDYVCIHCRNMHQAGQIGVAVGRARSTDGLQVVDFRPQLLSHHPVEVLDFTDEPGVPFHDNLSCCQMVIAHFLTQVSHPADFSAPGVEIIKI